MRGVLSVAGPYLFVLDSKAWWTRDTWFLLLLHAPGALVELIPYSFVFGACLPLRPFRYRLLPKIRSFRFLRVCLVTKGMNVLVGTRSSGLILHTVLCLHSALAARQ